MTKAEIVERIYERVGFSKKEAADVVESIFEVVKTRLEDGEKVKISGFGNFVINEKRRAKARILKPAKKSSSPVAGFSRSSRARCSSARSTCRRRRAKGRRWAVAEEAVPLDKLYFKIGEVAKIVGVKPYVLRYWETEFSMVRPGKTRSKHRLYRRKGRRHASADQGVAARPALHDRRVRASTCAARPTLRPFHRTARGVAQQLRKLREIRESLLDLAQGRWPDRPRSPEPKGSPRARAFRRARLGTGGARAASLRQERILLRVDSWLKPSASQTLLNENGESQSLIRIQYSASRARMRGSIRRRFARPR
jgi:nucleoid DNA-binding protein